MHAHNNIHTCYFFSFYQIVHVIPDESTNSLNTFAEKPTLLFSGCFQTELYLYSFLWHTINYSKSLETLTYNFFVCVVKTGHFDDSFNLNIICFFSLWLNSCQKRNLVVFMKIYILKKGNNPIKVRVLFLSINQWLFQIFV